MKKTNIGAVCLFLIFGILIFIVIRQRCDILNLSNENKRLLKAQYTTDPNDKYNHMTVKQLLKARDSIYALIAPDDPARYMHQERDTGLLIENIRYIVIKDSNCLK